MKSIRISHPHGRIRGTVNLPVSKSESNRALLLQALSKGLVSASRISEAEDSRILNELIQSESEFLDAGHAGTAVRFLCAYLAFRPGKKILSGSQRMKERPIGPLVVALNTIGADVRYLEKEGYLPLEIRGVNPKDCGGKIRITASVSSQFLSALAMVAPTLGKGLEMELEGERSSEPYFFLTLDMLRRCGIRIDQIENTYIIPPQEFSETLLHPEPDWSSAAYLYSIAALSQSAEIRLPDLNASSLQADAVVMNIFPAFGVYTQADESGLTLRTAKPGSFSFFRYDFRNCPDLAQTLIALCAALGIPAEFSGIESLRIKETDRVFAMGEELDKVGAVLTGEGKGICRMQFTDPPGTLPVFHTWGDHRVALSLAPLCLAFGEIEIQDPDVVKKSWPGFWLELKKLGFEIREK